MKQQNVVSEQFGNTAQAYLTSAVHAMGEDLSRLRQLAARHEAPRVLDLGCGAGHVSFALAPVAHAVVAYDLAPQMLEVVAGAARERRLGNIETCQGQVEQLPFEDGAFDIVTTRFSAHHWSDVPQALNEVRRVLKPGGVFLLVDIVAPESPLNDTILQTVEILRDASHVRDYRVSEWRAMLAGAGFREEVHDSWNLPMRFDEWVARMRTPADRVQAIRSVFDAAPEEARQHFSLQADHSFSIGAALIEARPAV